MSTYPSNPQTYHSPSPVGERRDGVFVLSILEDTMVDGPGFRTAIYCAGCPNACPGCHNPQSWDIHAGHVMTTEAIMQIIEADPYANVTFSGGDPMFQPEGFAELASAIRRRTEKTIWCFTGYTFEALLRNPRQRKLLEQLDVLVDGPFIQRLRDPDLRFRGSSNQRIIDVPASLRDGVVVLWQSAA
ncbi:MAG: anaerobic ribonucleoside-triphosphate reductase activating protein [Prevotella sp.]|nr:anaerobic ribonucleoside-triphosphate reductase activating protein [Prevotella sp.]